MAIQELGRTTNFIVQYDDAISSAQTRAQAVLSSCENDLYKLSLYLPMSVSGPSDLFRDANDTIAPQRVFIQVLDQPASLDSKSWPPRGGANNNGRVPFGGIAFIRINPLSPSGMPITDDFARFLFVAEMAEQMMHFYGWDGGSCQGEALSRIFAELFYPASAYDAASSVSIAPWINQWLNANPRPDRIATDLPNDDTNQIDYGCGMLFINYLCSQLGLSLTAVCGAGGKTLADRYYNLTHGTDDPFSTMTSLLDKHFIPGTFFNLLNNNPFPLFDAPDRKVSFAFRKIMSLHPVPEAGVAYLSPFLTCPARDYSYFGVGFAVQWIVTATALGFGQPRFQWRINGIPLPSTSGTLTIPVDLEIPDASNPSKPKLASGLAAFEFTYSDSFSRDGFSNVLTLRNDAFGGNYLPKIEVDVTEPADAAGKATSSNVTLGFDSLHYQYEAQYYIDKQKCEDAFQEALSHVPKLEKMINIVHTLPDPPYGPRVSDVIDAIDQLRAEVAHVAESNAHHAAQLAQYIGAKLKISPQVILQKTGSTRDFGVLGSRPKK